MKKILLLNMLLLLTGCENRAADSSTWQAGQVLSERVQNLGSGFLLVYREVVNPPDHWEGVGHFSFLYFRERQLCQCSSGDFSIAPSARYAIFQDGSSGKLFIFKAQTGSLFEATTKYIGAPETFTWDEAKGLVTVAFYQGLNNGYKDAEPISVQLQ